MNNHSGMHAQVVQAVLRDVLHFTVSHRNKIVLGCQDNSSG